MSTSAKSAVRRLLDVATIALLVATTWLCFGPIAAFHHDVGYGVLFYMVSGGEDADPGDFVFLGQRFWFFPLRFIATLGLWFFLVAGLFSFWRECRRRLPHLRDLMYTDSPHA